MQYENFELFPTVVTRYSYDPDKIETIKEICKEIREKTPKDSPEYSTNINEQGLHHYFNQSGLSILHEIPELQELKEWSQDCARHFLTQVLDWKVEDDNKMLITDSWMNVCEERASQQDHNHHNCIVSGTYYVHREEWVHSGIEFYHQNIEMWPTLMLQRDWNDNSNKYTRRVETLYPSSGDLILWSSNLRHGYYGMTNFWEGRTTISMNFLPQTIDNGKYTFTIKER